VVARADGVANVAIPAKTLEISPVSVGATSPISATTT
jgi:hypothetical protein